MKNGKLGKTSGVCCVPGAILISGLIDGIKDFFSELFFFFFLSAEVVEVLCVLFEVTG